MVTEAYKSSPRGSNRREFFEGMKDGLEENILGSELGYHWGRRIREKHQDSLIQEIPIWMDVYKAFRDHPTGNFDSIPAIEEFFQRVLAA